MAQATMNAPDLGKDFPRSPNDSLGGYVLLPRIIDKCRATVAGTNGEYNFNCPLDRRFFDWTGIDADAFRELVAGGATDEEIVRWVRDHDKAHTEEEVLAWSYTERWRRPDEERKAHFERMRLDFAPGNYRIETWFQLLDADEKRF